MPVRLTTGPRVGLFINSKPFGRVSDFSFNEDTGIREIAGIDMEEVSELAPGATRVSGTINVYKVSQDGGAEGAGMTAPMGLKTNSKYFSIALIERITDTVLFEATKCMLVSQAWSAPSKGFVRGVINFKAIIWQNEVSS